MPGFADNLHRMCQAAGLTAGEAARRLGAGASDLEAWLSRGALPELHVLARLADTIGCRVDDLLIGEDADFDHPQRRHAALIAARMARVRVLLAQVRVARHRGEFTGDREARFDEASLLATVEACRAWVMSADHDVGAAATIEAGLDRHLERLAGVLAEPLQGWSDGAPRPAATAGPGRPATGAGIQPGPGPVAPSGEPAGVAAAALPGGTVRARGHRSTLWAHVHDDKAHECVMRTRASEVDVDLRIDDRVVETRTCRTLDEALRQSSEWKRTYLAPAILALPEIPR